jgi:hypothetical protein
MKHYRATINGYPVGRYRIFKEGSFFVDRRWYNQQRAQAWAANINANGVDKAIISMYVKKQVILNGLTATVYDEVTE